MCCYVRSIFNNASANVPYVIKTAILGKKKKEKKMSVFK